MTGLDLRPLSLGEILDRSFSLYRRYFLLFMGIAAIPSLLTLALSLAQTFFVENPVAGNRGGTSQIASHDLGTTLIFTGLTLIASVFVYLFSQGGTISAVSQLYLGRETSMSACFRRVWKDIGSLFGVVLLTGLATAGAALLLIVPGIYVGCRLLVSLPVAIVEGRGPSESLSRSWNLTRDNAGRAFVIVILYFILTLGLGGIVAVFFSIGTLAARNDPAMLRVWLALQQVLTTIINIIVDPFLLIATSVFYFDLRVRKEAFDLQFMMDPTSERVTGGDGPIPSIQP